MVIKIRASNDDYFKGKRSVGLLWVFSQFMNDTMEF